MHQADFLFRIEKIEGDGGESKSGKCGETSEKEKSYNPRQVLMSDMLQCL